MEKQSKFDGDGGGTGKPIAFGGTSMDTDVSMEIKILSEVEKIWINFDLDQNGTLEYSEVCKYLKERCPHIGEEHM